jgi:hypothetical protein
MQLWDMDDHNRKDIKPKKKTISCDPRLIALAEAAAEKANTSHSTIWTLAIAQYLGVPADLDPEPKPRCLYKHAQVSL